MEISRILIVDDEPDIREATALILSRMGGFSVSTVSSGEQCLLAAREDSPDLIILDMMMPGMSGLDVFKELAGKECTKNIPVIFLTASASKRDVKACLEAGAAGVIEKPFDPAKLPKMVKEIAGRL